MVGCSGGVRMMMMIYFGCKLVKVLLLANDVSFKIEQNIYSCKQNAGDVR